MNRLHCERETEIIEAARSGGLNAELHQHALSCSICSDIAAVSVSLFFQSTPTNVPLLPDSDFLWWKAQLTGKQIAVEQATRSITLVRKAAFLSVIPAALWLLFGVGRQSIEGAFSKKETFLAAGLTQTALFLAIVTLLFTLLSSLYLARSED